MKNNKSLSIFHFLLFFILSSRSAFAFDSILGLSLGDQEEKIKIFISSELKNNILLKRESKKDKNIEILKCRGSDGDYINLELKENYLSELDPLVDGKSKPEYKLYIKYNRDYGLYDVDYNIYLNAKTRDQCIENINILQSILKIKNKSLICDQGKINTIYEDNKIKSKEVSCHVDSSNIILRSVYSTILGKCIYSVEVVNHKIKDAISEQNKSLYEGGIGNAIKEKKIKNEKEFKVCFKPIFLWNSSAVFYKSDFDSSQKYTVSCVRKSQKIFSCNWKSFLGKEIKKLNELSNDYGYNPDSYEQFVLVDKDFKFKKVIKAAFKREIRGAPGCNGVIEKDEYTGYFTDYLGSESLILKGEECDF